MRHEPRRALFARDCRRQRRDQDDHRQLERERKPAGGADAPATAERGIKSEATVRVFTDNLAASVPRRQTEQRVDSCLERARKLMMIGQARTRRRVRPYALPLIFAT